MAGGRIEILIDPDVKGFEGKLRGAMAGPLATASGLGKQLAVAVGVGTVGAAFGAVIKQGNDFTDNLNTLGAVSQATDAQLQAVSTTARQLGADNTIVGASAGSAAAAMTELAKGGMSVEQSQTAARGTLQLAAAAQVEAAQAATIQSSALQAFALDASEAGRVSDVLANSANASSAEITDVAQALQQSGTVARQFGVDVDDTATAIAMFANAGIKGSDAGTLLKSALLALTDQSKPAQGAMEELGLAVYDAQGKFVGLPALFGQLAAAQKRMTPEAYQAATATLFGSDAMRLAGIAGQQGAEGFTKLNVAINRQGAAAEVAAARTKGLPGALNNLQNQAETAAVSVYDLVKGPLTGLANFAAGGLEKAPAAIEQVTRSAAPAASALGRVVETVAGLPTPVQAALAGLVALRVTGLGSGIESRATAVGSAFRSFGRDLAEQQRYAAVWHQDIGRANAALAVMEARSPAVRALGESYRAGAAPAAAWARAQDGAARSASVAAGRSRDLFLTVDRVGAQAMHSGAAGLARFASVASGTATASMTGLKMAASGVVGALGGPWMLGLTAATAVVTDLVSSAASAAQTNRALARASTEVTVAQNDLYTSLVKANGAMDGQAMAAAQRMVGAELDKTTARAQQNHNMLIDLTSAMNRTTMSYSDFVELARSGNSAWDRQGAATEAAKLEQQALTDALNEAQLSQKDLNRIVAEGGPEYDRLVASLRNTGAAGDAVAQKLSQTRQSIEGTKVAASRASAGTAELSESLAKFADKTSTADERAKSLRASLDALAGINKTAADAVQGHDDAIRKITDDLQSGWDASKGFGDGLLDSAGKLSTASENGSKLRTELLALRDATATAASANADMGPVWERNNQTLDQMASALGISGDKMRQLAADVGLLPDVIQTHVQLQGADATVQKVAEVGTALAGVPAGKTITTKCDDKDTIAALRALGWMVEELPGGQIKVTATTEEARKGLIDTAIEAAKVGGMTPMLKVLTNAKEVVASLDRVGIKAEALPDGRVEITDTTPENMARLKDLGIEVAKDKQGRVFIADNSLQVRENIDKNLQNRDTSSTHTIKIQTVSSYGGETTIDGVTARVGNYYGADGGIVEAYASGGIATLEQYANGKFPLAYNPAGVLPAEAVIERPQGARGLVQWAEAETEGEAFIPLAKSKRKKSVQIWAETGRRLGVLTEGVLSEVLDSSSAASTAMASAFDGLGIKKFAEGGILASGLVEFAKGVEGAPYVFGGIQWGDCSAAVAALANWVSGRAPFGSRFSTATEGEELAARGFLPGAGSMGDLRVGWFNGGPGGGHTAATLPNGINFEMGGARGNGQYGGAAAGWNLSGATNWAHFPMARFSDLDKAVKAGALSEALKGLGATSGPDRAPVSTSAGVDGSRGVPAGTGSQSGGSAKSISEIVGEFGKDLFAGAATDFMQIVGKSNDTGPIVGALLAYDAAAKNGFKAQERPSDGSTTASGGGADGPIVLPGLGDTAQVINFDPKAGAAQWRPLIRQGLQITGQSQADADRTEQQMDIESGGDPKVVNGWDSNAQAGNPSKGLMQVIETTKDAVKARWPEHFVGLSDDLLNPLTNIVAGIDACVNSWGSLAARWPTTEGYASGGKFMAAGVADRVAPSTFRLIGDRADVDEYYLPDNDDPRTLAFGQEWAQRRGFQLLRMDQVAPASGRELVTASAVAQPRTTVVNNYGADRRDVSEAIYMAHRREAFEQRRNER